MSHEEKDKNGNTKEDVLHLHKSLNVDIEVIDDEVNDVIEYVEKSITEINMGLNKID